MASLAEIGQALKEARERQGFSLDEVAVRTHIALKHLKAIEAGEAQELPEVFYVRGFLKKYAEMVGLPPQEVADAFHPPAQAAASSTPGWAFTLGPVVYYAAILLGIAGLLALAWHFQPKISVVTVASPSPPALPSPERAASSASGVVPARRASSAPARSASVTATPTATTTQTPGATPTPRVSATASQAADVPEVLGLSARERAWVQVVVNGKKVFTGTLTAGDQRRFSGRSIAVTAGNAGGVLVNLNGHNQGALGPEGKPVTRSYHP